MPEHNQALVNKYTLNFQLLSDPVNYYAAELGLRFELPDDLKEVYADIGIAPQFHCDGDFEFGSWPQQLFIMVLLKLS